MHCPSIHIRSYPTLKKLCIFYKIHISHTYCFQCGFKSICLKEGYYQKFHEVLGRRQNNIHLADCKFCVFFLNVIFQPCILIATLGSYKFKNILVTKFSGFSFQVPSVLCLFCCNYPHIMNSLQCFYILQFTFSCNFSLLYVFFFWLVVFFYILQSSILQWDFFLNLEIATIILIFILWFFYLSFYPNVMGHVSFFSPNFLWSFDSFLNVIFLNTKNFMYSIYLLGRIVCPILQSFWRAKPIFTTLYRPQHQGCQNRLHKDFFNVEPSTTFGCLRPPSKQPCPFKLTLQIKKYIFQT